MDFFAQFFVYYFFIVHCMMQDFVAFNILLRHIDEGERVWRFKQERKRNRTKMRETGIDRIAVRCIACSADKGLWSLEDIMSVPPTLLHATNKTIIYSVSYLQLRYCAQ